MSLAKWTATLIAAAMLIVSFAATPARGDNPGSYDDVYASITSSRYRASRAACDASKTRRAYRQCSKQLANEGAAYRQSYSAYRTNPSLPYVADWGEIGYYWTQMASNYAVLGQVQVYVCDGSLMGSYCFN